HEIVVGMRPAISRKKPVHDEKELLIDEKEIPVVRDKRSIAAALPRPMEAPGCVFHTISLIEQRPKVLLWPPRRGPETFPILSFAVDENDAMSLGARRINVNRPHDVRMTSRVNSEVRPESVELVRQLVFVRRFPHRPDVEEEVDGRGLPATSERHMP